MTCQSYFILTAFHRTLRTQFRAVSLRSTFFFFTHKGKNVSVNTSAPHLPELPWLLWCLHTSPKGVRNDPACLEVLDMATPSSIFIVCLAQGRRLWKSCKCCRRSASSLASSRRAKFLLAQIIFLKSIIIAIFTDDVTDTTVVIASKLGSEFFVWVSIQFACCDASSPN